MGFTTFAVSDIQHERCPASYFRFVFFMVVVLAYMSKKTNSPK